MLKPLPASTYTFQTIIEGGFLYVDKTQYIYDLIRYPAGIYFLSRPRRFGKSLLISTLEAIFRGNKELFRGLWLYTSDYQWQTYPVIHIDFSRHRIRNAAELEARIQTHLSHIAGQYQVTLPDASYDVQFEALLLKLSKEKQVVILIDEYDKPIIDNIENKAEAIQIREILKAFYTVIKSMDAYVRFVFITGISKFSRVGVFSSMNNLVDLTLNPRFATALGLTEDEIRQNFQDYIAAFVAQEGLSVEEFLHKMRYWYNGFCFAADQENVYNPFSTLHLFYHQRFSNYWFESGTPTFLIKLIKEGDYDIQPLNQLEVEELAFSTYEIENLAIIPLLFQTGYLTIKDYQKDDWGGVYTLSYPNFEVKNAFLTYLLNAYNAVEIELTGGHLRKLIRALRAKNFPQFFSILDVFFANIDYDLHLKHEKYYQTIFYLIFLLLGLRIEAEVKTNRGRIDAVVILPDHIFIFEFKLDGKAETALKQIKETEYYQKYRLQNQSIILIGASFDSEKRKVTDWETEPV